MKLNALGIHKTDYVQQSVKVGQAQQMTLYNNAETVSLCKLPCSLITKGLSGSDNGAKHSLARLKFYRA